jgi:hypothetical protein
MFDTTTVIRVAAGFVLGGCFAVAWILASAFG